MADANLAAIVWVASDVDTVNAGLAKATSINPAVLAFADRMIADHATFHARANDFVTRLGVTPEEDETSRNLVSSANAMREALRGRRGTAFDRGYIDLEVARQEAILRLFDESLIPRTLSPESRALLLGLKPVFEAHLDHARQVQASLAKDVRREL